MSLYWLSITETETISDLWATEAWEGVIILAPYWLAGTTNSCNCQRWVIEYSEVLECWVMVLQLVKVNRWWCYSWWGWRCITDMCKFCSAQQQWIGGWTGWLRWRRHRGRLNLCTEFVICSIYLYLLLQYFVGWGTGWVSALQLATTSTLNIGLL